MAYDRRMDKEDVIYMLPCIHTHTHTHTMDYYSAVKKDEIMPFSTTCKDLEIIILSEVSQRQICDITCGI